MAEPRYRPRDFCVPPELFGKVPLHRSQWSPVPVPGVDRLTLSIWQERETEQRVLMDAARMQHAYAVTIRALMKERQLTLGDYAKLTGRDSGKRIGAFLRGEVVMRFDDVSWAEHVFGGVRQRVHREMEASASRRRPDA